MARSSFDNGTNRGWVGTWTDLDATLGQFKVDRMPDGRPVLDGDITFLPDSHDEFVVGETAVYYFGGEPHSLVYILRAAGRGMPVNAIEE